MARLTAAQAPQINEIVEKVTKRDLAYLQTSTDVLETLTGSLNNRFIVDPTFTSILTKINNGLNIQDRLDEIDEILNDPTIDPATALPIGLNDRLRELRAQIALRNGDINAQQGIINGLIGGGSMSKDEERTAKVAQTEVKRFEAQKIELERQVTTTQTDIKKIEEEETRLTDFWTTYEDIIAGAGGMAPGTVRERMQQVINTANRLNHTNRLPRLEQNVGEPAALINHRDGAGRNLPNIFFGGAAPAGTQAYAFCNEENGDPLTITRGAIEAKTVDGKTVTVRGITINGDDIQCQNVTLDPATELTFPVSIHLNVRARVQEPNTGINLDCFKPLEITINRRNFTAADRGAAVDAYENTNGNTITNRINREFDAQMNDIAKAAIFAALEKGDGPKFNALTKEQKDILYDRIRPTIRNADWTVAAGAPARAAAIEGAQVRNFNNYRDRFSHDNHEGNTPQNTHSPRAYADYIHNNFVDQIPKFFTARLNTTLVDNQAANTFLKTSLSNFEPVVGDSKEDNDDHIDARNTLAANRRRPTNRPGNLRQRLRNKKSAKNNYTKFLSDRSHEITNTFEGSKGPIKYSIRVHVDGVNRFAATIKIADEKEPLILTADDPYTLMENILNKEIDANDEPMHRKLRCYMALDALKAIVQMSPTRLRAAHTGAVEDQNGQPHNVDRLESFVRGDKLIIRGAENTHANRQRTYHTIFDETTYKTLNDVTQLTRGLMRGADQLTGILDAMGHEYDEAIHAPKLRPLMKYKTTYPLRGRRAKKLRARMRGIQTNWEFDFQTTAQVGERSVQILFEKGKFTLQGSYKGQEYNFSGKNLGKLLRKEINGQRAFDGIELEVLSAVNEQMAQQLMTNHYVANKTYYVTDRGEHKTGRAYFFDNTGQLSYIDIEDAAHNPLPGGRDYGELTEEQRINMQLQTTVCNAQERKEVMQNPLLAGRLIQQMRHTMRLF